MTVTREDVLRMHAEEVSKGKSPRDARQGTRTRVHEAGPPRRVRMGEEIGVTKEAVAAPVFTRVGELPPAPVASLPPKPASSTWLWVGGSIAAVVAALLVRR
jgi:hypothetical protein